MVSTTNLLESIPVAGTAAHHGVATPTLLKRWLIAIVVLSVLTAGGSLLSSQAARDAVRVIGRQTEPSVALSLRIESLLADMDASALADSLVEGGAATGTSARFAADTRALAGEMVTAAHLAGNDTGSPPLRDLQVELLNYEQAVVEARYIGQRNAWLAARRQEWASRVNRYFAIRAAQALQTVNADLLEERYVSYQNSSRMYGWFVIGGCALLAVVLLAVQRWLSRRTRRVINPPLAAATFLVVVGGVWFGVAAATERSTMEAAKSAAYDNLHALYQAKATVSALYADASLWLFDVAAHGDAATQMDDDMTALNGQLLPNAGAYLAGGLAPPAAAAAAAHAPLRSNSLFGTILAGVASSGLARDATSEAAQRLVESVRAIETMQDQGARRLRAQAIVQWLSGEPGGGAASFAKLQAALDGAIAVNQSAFDQAVADARANATTRMIVTTLALVAGGALGALGLMLRLREYR